MLLRRLCREGKKKCRGGDKNTEEIRKKKVGRGRWGEKQGGGGGGRGKEEKTSKIGILERAILLEERRG